jgi:hypothetical protein
MMLICHLKLSCVAFRQARLVISLFEINTETIAYYCLFMFCRFRSGYFVGVPAPLWLFDPM